MSDHKQSASRDGDRGRDDVELARQALSKLSLARADDRESWIKIGMALHSVNDALSADWVAWSRQSDKFKEGECEKQWRSFKHDKARSIGIGTLVKLAREDSGDSDFGKRADSSETRRSFTTLNEVIAHLERQTGGAHVGTWAYERADGHLALHVVRFDQHGNDAQGKQTKTYRPIRPAAGGFEIGDPSGLLPLYRTRSLPVDGPVYVVEGEKAADAGAQIGVPTTTSAHGANSAAKSDWSALRGRDVRILPDNDHNGQRYAQQVAAICHRLLPCATVRIVALPDLPSCGDIDDFVEVRRAAGKSNDEIRAEIVALADASAPYAGNAGGLGAACSDFPEPGELPNTRPPVPVFDCAFLPESLARWVSDIAERMQCAPDFVFAAVLVALSALVGRKVAIRPKRFDSWTVTVNLWGAVVGRPGILKSPAVQEALKPLRDLERDAKQRFKEDEKAHKASQLLAQARRKALEKELNKAAAKGGGEDIAAQMAADEPVVPIRRRYIVNDSTVEKLGEILNENPNGVLVFRDEIVGLLRSLEKEGQEGARAFYLQAWNGDSSYTYDRIGRGTIEIDAAIISVFGSIQPGPLEQYLHGAALGGKGDDGLLQRFQIVVFPDQTKDWHNHDREPDATARSAAVDVFRSIDVLEPEAVGAQTDPSDDNSIPFLRFSDEAQERFDAWRARLEVRLRSGSESEAFESHLAKYRSLVPSLALLYHLAEARKGPVSASALSRAIATGEYLEGHARRVYATTLAPDVAAAHALAAKLRARELKDGFTLRDVYQKGWSGLADKQSVEPAIGVLIDLDWLVPERDEHTGGAPKTRYRINPRIWSIRDQATPKTGRSSTSVGEENKESDNQGAGTTGTSRSQGLAQVMQVSGEPLDENRRAAPRPADETSSEFVRPAARVEPDAELGTAGTSDEGAHAAQKLARGALFGPDDAGWEH
jgi:putative DNA primase/helicase